MPGLTSSTAETPDTSSELVPALSSIPPRGEELQSVLEEFIFSAKAKPGDRLPSERKLASLFSVSRQTLREVLRSMEGQGLITVQAGRGSYIQDQTKAGPYRVIAAARQGSVTPADLIEARLMIECAAAGLAALRRTDEDLAVLWELCNEHMKPTTDANESAIADVKFHERIAEASNNPVLLILFGSIKNLVFGTITRSLTDHTISNLGVPLHHKVVEAIEARDSVKAQELMKQILLIGEEKYGDDLHLPLAKVLRTRAQLDPAHRALMDAAAEMVTETTNSLDDKNGGIK
jgi:GntR family transcriptional regulator, transcriptional repressor for pyruvate dehydrogenase complex